ncbi:trehalose-phosphatase [Diaminobutyricimonas sp. TR449]|uniref:trehalose-phosphatase n=1 Tax=Diaminobutyricimonas sp. TR449 TaxID=2708076 RepID=UPI001FBA9059|nr:trehalose-phosphatase [Diaminobutyricimonas sp. TR449]
MTSLDPALLADLEKLAGVDRLLVTLDFDGTLAPFVDEPEHARALPAAHHAVLRLLQTQGTRVALISGRALGSLEIVAGLPDNTLLVGSHGVELRLDSEPLVSLSDEELRQRKALERVLGGIADSVDQVWLETKPAGFALHTRLATEENSRIAHQRALSQVQAEVENYTVREGKNVLEFSVRSATKGEAIEHLRRYTEADAVLFAGDDVTDEDGFAALRDGDFGLKSGPGETLANHRVPGPEDVAEVLEKLASLRESRSLEG